KDLDGMKVGGAPGGATELLFPAFQQAVGIDPGKNMMVNLESSSKLQALLDGQVDGVLSFAFLQLPILKQNGFEADAFLYAENGVNTPSLSLVASQKTIDNNPEMVKAFIRATKKGF